VRAYALIPFRGGGKRFGGDKELIELGGVPMAAWTIRAAVDSGVFDRIIAVCANSAQTWVAETFGAEVPGLRPEETLRDDSLDIEWVKWILSLVDRVDNETAVSILRVTSPFRDATHIQEAWQKFINARGADSLRTVTQSNQDVFKTWVIRDDRLLPLYPIGEEQPWHSRPSQLNPKTFVQTAGMEFAWGQMVLRTNTIAGSVVVPYVVEGLAALDINYRKDYETAVWAVESGLVEIPTSLRRK
jgi:CMP-N-acetylneuraminic acid synthetase